MNSSTNPVDIRPDHLAIVRDILRAHLPAGFEVWVFGSRANWTTKDSSDLDLAVEGAAKLDYRIMGDLEIAFEESDLPYAVDVVDLKDVSPEFKNIVDSQKVPLLATADHPNPAEEWEERPFEEVIDFREGPGILAKDFREDGVPLVRLAGLSRGASVLAGCNYLDPESSAKRWDQFRLEFGDVLLSTSASLGRIAVVGEEGIGAVPYTGIIRMRPRDTTVHRPFIRYLLEGPDFQQQCEVVGVGSVIRHFGPMHLRQMTLKIPPLPEQRAIAHILGTLDDKIELNRRMNHTLEAMAQAIFQDWFVDFGPVRAKLEGSDPYLPPELWNLFPDRLVDSESGEIPEGWDVSSLGKCFNLTMGQSPPGSTYNDYEGLPFFQGSSDFGPRFPTNRKFCTAPTRTAEADDTLVSVRAPVGTLNMAWEKCCIGRGVAALRHKSGSSPFSYYSAWTIQSEFQQYEQTGTVFGAITKKQLEAVQTISPPDQLVREFDTLVKPLEGRLKNQVSESRSLASQRDRLLPKIITGVLRARAGEHDG